MRENFKKEEFYYEIWAVMEDGYEDHLWTSESLDATKCQLDKWKQADPDGDYRFLVFKVTTERMQ